MICKNCGNSLPQSANFCNKCGQSLVSPPPSANEKAAQDRASGLKKRKTGIRIAAALLISAALFVLCFKVIIPEIRYRHALSLMESQKYEEASDLFYRLDGYRDSDEKQALASAEVLVQKGDLYKAATLLYKHGEDDACRQRCFEIWRSITGLHTLAAKRFAAGVKADGTVVLSPEGEGYDTSGWTGIVSVAVGGGHVVGLRSDGTVVAVGSNYSGQCNVKDWRDIVMVDAGDNYTVGLRADGTVVATGSNSQGQCDVSDWEDIKYISCGWYHTVGVRADGTAVAVGEYMYDVKNVIGWEQLRSVSAGAGITTGVRGDGSIYAVGLLDTYAMRDDFFVGWDNIAATSVGARHIVGLRDNGKVVAVGQTYYGQCDVSGWSDIVEIAAGNYCTLGLKKDGTVVVVGDLELDSSEWSDMKTF